MQEPLEKISLEGFKSIRSLKDFSLNSGLNILIGANGAGKSNFVEFFRLMEQITLRNLNGYVAQFGGAETFFFHGTETTDTIKVELKFKKGEYSFFLHPTTTDRVLIGFEKVSLKTQKDGLPFTQDSVTVPPLFDIKKAKESEATLFSTNRNIIDSANKTIYQAAYDILRVLTKE